MTRRDDAERWPNQAQSFAMSNSGRSVDHPPAPVVTLRSAASARLASFVCLELSGFVLHDVTEQAAARAHAQSFLRTCLASWPKGSWRVLDLQQRLLIQLPDSPVHALCLVLELLQAPDAWRLEWKMGVHVGVYRDEVDLQGLARPSGEGVSRAIALAGYAAPGQAVASRAFVDAVRHLHVEYASLFESSIEETVLVGDRWRIQPSAAVLEQLRLEMTVSPQPSEGIADETSIGMGLGQARELISRWFIPFNALIFSIAMLLAQGSRIGLTSDRLRIAGLALGLLGLIWLVARAVLRRKYPTRRWLAHRGVAWVLVAYGAFLGIGAHLSGNMTGPGPTGEAAALQPPHTIERHVAPVELSATTGTQAQTPHRTSAVATSDLAPLTTSSRSQSPAVPAPERRAMGVAAKEKATVAQVPADGPNNTATSTRCSAIVARSALGEPLSPKDQQELLTSCR